MTHEERAELRRVAEYATGGPWHVCDNFYSGRRETIADITGMTVAKCSDTRGHVTPQEANAAYIAAANPSAVLSLLDALDAAEARAALAERQVRVLAEWAGTCCGACPVFGACGREAEKCDAEKLRECNEARAAWSSAQAAQGGNEQ